MGIITNALSISLGAILGSFFKGKTVFKNFNVFGIGIMIISIVGFLENIFNVMQMQLSSDDLIVVVFALIFGTALGDMLNIEERLSSISAVGSKSLAAFIDASVFFGVGGLQICGAIMLVARHDSSQLYLKSIVDFPFAVLFGASYGKIVSVSSIPVFAGQILICIITYIAGTFLSGAVITQLCAIGYIILFFSGFNILCPKQYKINNINMLPGVIVILLWNVILYYQR